MQLLSMCIFLQQVLQLTTFSPWPLKLTLQSHGRSSSHLLWDQPLPPWSSSLQLWSSLLSVSGQILTHLTNSQNLVCERWIDKSLLGKTGKIDWRRTLLHWLINSGQPTENRTFEHSFLSTLENIEIASNVNFVCMSSKPPQNTLSGLPCHLWGYWMPD